MSLYYVLAKTVVNGEIVIQGISITYSASASGFDSANTSFKDAAKVATIASNSAAIIAARKTVDSILAQYSYVLSEEDITSMISNSLKTEIHPIIPLALASIASTVDGLNYILNKDTTIAENEYLLIPNDYSLTIDVGKFIFNNSGIISVGERRDPLTKGRVGCSTTNKADSSTTCCSNYSSSSANVSYTNSSSITKSVSNYNTVNNAGCCTIGSNVTYVNYGVVTNNACWVSSPASTYNAGQTQNSSSIDPAQSGSFINNGYFYSG